MPSVVAKAVLKGRLLGEVQTRNIFYGQADVVLPDTQTMLAILYISEVLTPIRSYISTLWTAEGVDVYNWVAGEWAFIGTQSWSWNGSSSADILPYQVAAVLLGKTLAKRKLGRKFIAGFTEGASTGASFTGAVLTALGTSALAYVTAYTSSAGSVWAPGIQTKGGTWYSFTGGAVSSLVGSMRRRKPGLGI